MNGLNLSIPNSGLYSPPKNSASPYLVETHSAFAALNQWQGSNYYFEKLNVDQEYIQKRLGDNAYEQRLVREQILQLTGRTVADGYIDEQSQFEKLFAAGAAQSQALDLKPGIGLSVQQIDALTQDVIIMEEREIETESGKQRAIVPVVYLARIKPGDLTKNGSLISADSIDLRDTQGFNNEGAIKAKQTLNVEMASGKNFNSENGRLETGAAMRIKTVDSDINLRSAQIKAGQLNLNSGANIDLSTNSQEVTYQSAGMRRTKTELGQIASIEVDGSASIKAAGNFTQNAVELNIGNQLNVSTGGSWQLGSVVKQEITDSTLRLPGTSAAAHTEVIRHQTSSVKVGGSLTAQAANFTAQGAQFQVGGPSQIQAQTINMRAVVNETKVQSHSHSKDHQERKNTSDQ